MAYRAEDYTHEADRTALESLKAIPGFTALLKAFMKGWSERQGKIRCMSSYIRIDENQLPKYKEMLIPICEKLGIEVPDLYLTLDVRPNAFTYGENDPYIVITSGLLEALPDELIPTILAHECGHIACHQVLYRTMGSILLSGAAGSAARLPVGLLLTLPMQAAFYYWMRCSEYSADRAAVLCDGTPAKMQEVCMRLAGFDRRIQAELNMDAFMQQAREYREFVNDSAWDRTLEFSLLAGSTHPFMAVRALECDEWAKSEQYRQILEGTYTKQTKESPVFSDGPVCPVCGTLNRPDTSYCRKCGAPLKQPLKNCPDCGAELDGTEMFCSECGRKLW